MAKKERSFVTKVKKDSAAGVPTDPETGEPIQFVRFVKVEKSPRTGTYKMSDSVVGVTSKNKKEIWG